MDRTRRLTKVMGFIVVVAMTSLAWSADAFAERRVGSLEFSHTSAKPPIGMVMLNHISDLRPSVTYQIPESAGVSFTTPWGVIIQSGVITGDTLIMLTNPDDAATLNIDVTLRDRDGVIGLGCTKTLALGPKKTTLRSSRSLFSGCPTVTP